MAFENEDLNLERCFEFVRNGFWTWFVTLKFPKEVGPEYTAQRCENPEDAFKVWFGEVSGNYGRGPSKTRIPYVRAIERRENGDVLYHVLLYGIPKAEQWHWKDSWKRMTAGSAWNRRLGETVEGLIKYLYYKIHCDIEYGFDCNETLCRANNHRNAEGE